MSERGDEHTLRTKRRHKRGAEQRESGLEMDRKTRQGGGSKEMKSYTRRRRQNVDGDQRPAAGDNPLATYHTQDPISDGIQVDLWPPDTAARTRMTLWSGKPLGHDPDIGLVVLFSLNAGPNLLIQLESVGGRDWRRKRHLGKGSGGEEEGRREEVFDEVCVTKKSEVSALVGWGGRKRGKKREIFFTLPLKLSLFRSSRLRGIRLASGYGHQ